MWCPVSKQMEIVHSLFHNYYVPPVIFASTRDDSGGRSRCASMGATPHQHPEFMMDTCVTRSSCPALPYPATAACLASRSWPYALTASVFQADAFFIFIFILLRGMQIETGYEEGVVYTCSADSSRNEIPKDGTDISRAKSITYGALCRKPLLHPSRLTVRSGIQA